MLVTLNPSPPPHTQNSAENSRFFEVFPNIVCRNGVPSHVGGAVGKTVGTHLHSPHGSPGNRYKKSVFILQEQFSNSISIVMMI